MDELITSLKNELLQDPNYTSTVRTLSKVLDRITTTPSMPYAAWHHTGFLVIELASSVEPAMLRLHIWPEKQTKALLSNWQIHSHSWYFRSFTLAGTVVDRAYDVQPETSGTSLNCLYQSRFNWGTPELVATNMQVSYKMISEKSYAAGIGHHIPQGVYHTTHSIGFASTIVLITDPSTQTSYIVGEKGGKEKYRRKQHYCNRDELNLLLDTLRTHLVI